MKMDTDSGQRKLLLDTFFIYIVVSRLNKGEGVAIEIRE